MRTFRSRFVRHRYPEGCGHGAFGRWVHWLARAEFRAPSGNAGMGGRLQELLEKPTENLKVPQVSP